ncbi:Mortality factor 4-like protein 2 [Lemmus lemmus]
MRGAASGKKSAGSQPKNLEPALPGRWGGRSAENPPSGSVRKTRKNKQKAPGNGDGGSTSEVPQPPRKKRARADPTVESEEAFKNRMELFQLPAKKNVDAILEEYANCKRSQGNVDNKEYAVNEVVGGIKEYFNVMLGTQLLYKFERPQYAEILLAHPDAPMSQIYGAPHLLRLFKSLALLLGYLHDFLKYLAKNSASLFTASDYKVASAEYHRKAL